MYSSIHSFIQSPRPYNLIVHSRKLFFVCRLYTKALRNHSFTKAICIHSFIHSRKPYYPFVHESFSCIDCSSKPYAIIHSPNPCEANRWRKRCNNSFTKSLTWTYIHSPFINSFLLVRWFVHSGHGRRGASEVDTRDRGRGGLAASWGQRRR